MLMRRFGEDSIRFDFIRFGHALCALFNPCFGYARQATRFRLEATTVRTGTHVEKDVCVRIVSYFPNNAYISAKKDDIDHVSRLKLPSFATVRMLFA
jgi:hypothetical protein